jgi:glycosyltransferase involved in cell wall biosynthesis
MKIRVCHIITKLELGGAQQNTLYTVSHLDRERFEPVLICGTGGILNGDAKDMKGVRVHFVPSLVRSIHLFKDPAALFLIRSILKRENPEIVHTHSSKAGILGRWAAFLAGIPVIIHTIHGFGFHNEQTFLKRWLFVTLERFTSLITTQFIAVSRDNVRTGSRHGILLEEKTELIRSGIRLSDFSSSKEEDGREFRKREKIPLTVPLIGMIGCLKPQKAPLDFVRIAAEVMKGTPDAYFVIAGDGELKAEVENEIRKRKLGERFLLLGWRRDIPALMRAVDVLVLPSLWEGLPRVIPEAMASGKPVVVTAIDGATDIVRDGENGFLIAPHDIGGFASRISLLLKGKALTEKFSRNSADLLDEFDIDRMVGKQEALYSSLMAIHRDYRAGSS